MEKNKVFYEVGTYLEYLGKKYIDKLPRKVYKSIQLHSNEYIKQNPDKKIDKNLFYQNGKKGLSKYARIIILKLDTLYFSESPKDKEDLERFIMNNVKTGNTDIFKPVDEKQKLDEKTLDSMYRKNNFVK